MMTEVNNENVIESLFKIMSSGTSTANDSRVTNNDYFKRRVLGFRAEVAFEGLLENYPDIAYLEGGQFISKKLSGGREDKNHFIYTTISADDPTGYKEIYKTIAGWSEVEELFYIKISDVEWKMTPFETRTEPSGTKNEDEILKPKYVFYLYNSDTDSFQKHRTQSFDCILTNFNEPSRTPNLYHLRKREQFNFFNEYSLEVLKKIYANRYFLDVVMRKAQGRQIIDLDGFLKTQSKTVVVEIKEKSPIKNKEEQTTWQYGWDSRRILWYLYLSKKIDLNILYNVRQITDREAREFVQWDSIFMNDFLKGTSWSNSRSGGGGEDTLLAPYTFFSRLEDILQRLSE